MQPYERLWERLLALLGTLGDVEAAPERLRVTLDRHSIELVMTQREWDELVTIPHGSFAGAAAHLLHVLVRARTDEAPYVVYDTYELHPSATPEPPRQAEDEADTRRVEAYLRDHPDAEVRWVAHRPGTERS